MALGTVKVPTITVQILFQKSTDHKRSQEGPRGAQAMVNPASGGPSSNRNATNDKNVTKKSCFFPFQFLLASSRTTAINNNIDDQEA